MNSFYSEMESGVRDYVKELRESGLNTQASCHHDGYILAHSMDATKELSIIEEVMLNHDDVDWVATLNVSFECGFYHSQWNITSADFIADN